MRYAADKYAHILKLLLDAGYAYPEADKIAREFR